jgi:nitrate reductase gamma subunit
MAEVPYVLAYLAIAVFTVAVIVRFRMWSKMPMHVRWELYPVAHEASKASYGGSYLEETDWWKQKREVSLIGELKVMIPEILFLVAVKEKNPKLWLRTFPFHFGLYLTIGSVALMLLVGLVEALAPGALAGASLASPVQTIIVIVGVAGLAIGIIGALGLLHRRLTSPDLKDFTTGADLFNLVFFILAFGCSLATFWLVDRDGAIVMRFATNLVSFKLVALEGTGLAMQLPLASIVLMSLLVAYVPLTHMSHFIGKYFAYHAIRWNDEPNLAGGDQEPVIQGLLNRPISWAASHIDGDGKKSWADVATTNPFLEKKEEKPKKAKKAKKEEEDK